MLHHGICRSVDCAFSVLHVTGPLITIIIDIGKWSCGPNIWPMGLEFDSYVLDEQSCMIIHLSVVRHAALLPDSSCLLCDVIGQGHWAGSQW